MLLRNFLMRTAAPLFMTYITFVLRRTVALAIIAAIMGMVMLLCGIVLALKMIAV